MTGVTRWNLPERLQLAPAWKVSDWGLSFWPVHHLFNFAKNFKWGPLKLAYKGSDEWGNPSIAIIIPLVGQLVYFYGKNLDRNSWFLSGSNGRIAHYVSPDYKFEANINYNGNFDLLFDTEPTLTYEEIRTRAIYIERLED